MPFSTFHNNLLYEIFCNCSHLFPVIAHFGKIFFMRQHLINWRRNFVRSSVNQSVYMLTLKQRGLHLWNLVQRCWREFLGRPQSDFLKNQSTFVRMIFLNIFMDFSTKFLLFHNSSHFCMVLEVYSS